MTVVYIIDNLLYGGAQKFLLQLVAGLRERGWKQHVVCLNRADEVLLERFQTLGVPVLRSSPLAFALQGTLLRLLRFLRREKPDLVVTLLTFSDLVGRTAARLAGVPARVSAIRGHKAGWELALGRLNARSVTAYIANAPTLLEHTRRGERNHTAAMCVIPNAVEERAFEVPERDSERRRLGIPVDVPLLLCLGRLSPEKGQHILLSAMPTVWRRHPRVHLLVVGNGKTRQALLDQASGDSRVRLLDAVADVRPLLAAADLLVIPSLHEAFPNVLLEAMAAARPVVASRYGAIPDTLLDGVTGLLAEPGNAEHLAAQINALLDRPERMPAMGEAGRARAREQFQVDAMVAAYHQQFVKLLSSPEAPCAA